MNLSRPTQALTFTIRSYTTLRGERKTGRFKPNSTPSFSKSEMSFITARRFGTTVCCGGSDLFDFWKMSFSVPQRAVEQ